MENLSPIQKRNNLNQIFASESPGPGGAYHDYFIVRATDNEEAYDTFLHVEFQRGPRSDPKSRTGVLDGDLLEIVRHRLQAFQRGEFATRENEMALQHVEEALLWMAKRADDRAERQVLGTMQK